MQDLQTLNEFFIEGEVTEDEITKEYKRVLKLALNNKTSNGLVK